MSGFGNGDLMFWRELTMVAGVVLVIAIIIGARLKVYKMQFELKKANGMTNEDREAIRDLRAAVQRIEERLEALETLAMEREREEKFGMKL